MTNDKGLFDRANFPRDHDRAPADFSFENSEVAFTYKMGLMQASLGLAPTERLDGLIAKKRQAFSVYAQRRSGIAGIALNSPGADVDGTCWMASIVWDESFGLTKKDVRDALTPQVWTPSLFSVRSVR